MNIKIEKSELVEIEGLTEAAVASSDASLIAIVNYADLAASYLPDHAAQDDQPGPFAVQLRDACMHELCRRHGDDYMLPESPDAPESILRTAP